MVAKPCAAALLRGLLLQALTAGAIFSQQIAIDLDPSKTTVEFTLGDVLHTVHGTFKLKSGHIDVDPEAKTISGQVIVNASSGESGSGLRDSRMKKNILEADRYPEITFAPSSMEGDLSAVSSVTVSGWFAIHGQRHRLSMPMQVKMSGGDVVVSGKFVVPYVAWGMKNPSTFLLRVNEKVNIEVTAKGAITRSSSSSLPRVGT